MELFENIWWLLVLIGVMILIHELGHFWAARLFDVRVETFSFGFGPRLFGFRKGETDFRFSLILFGGYVKMLGEQPGDQEAALDPRSFLAKPRWQRLIIAFAGPFMNVVLAVVLLTGLFTRHYERPPESSAPGTIGHVSASSPAGQAGIRAGDRIIEINGKREPAWEDIIITELSSAGRTLNGKVLRDGGEIPFSLMPKLDESSGISFAGWSREMEIEIIGFVPGTNAERSGLQLGDVIISVNGKLMKSLETLSRTANESAGKSIELVYSRNDTLHKIVVEPTLTDVGSGEKRWLIGINPAPKLIVTQLSLPDAFRESVRQNMNGTTLIYQFVYGIIQQRMSPKALEGPIRIAQLSGDAAREGPFRYIELMAMVSLNLAIFNLLPIPILDGGLILMLLVEMAMRRDLSIPVKETIIKVGFVFLMMVVVFVIYNDLTKVLPG